MWLLQRRGKSGSTFLRKQQLVVLVRQSPNPSRQEQKAGDSQVGARAGAAGLPGWDLWSLRCLWKQVFLACFMCGLVLMEEELVASLRLS